ncbi:MAG: hypothetical protein DSY42_03230 [Aquifex sp.]|nr:MAG: hypothetical protein DSY42_03230 [Aquifex sp.]
MSFVIAKQPIYDKDGNVFGYEVYLRSKDSPEKYPSEVPFSKAAYIVTDILVEYGIDRVSEGKKVILNVSLESLLNKSLEILPKEKVVFDLNPSEVPIGDTIYKKILEKIKDFKRKGTMFILNQSLYTSKYKDLINLSDIVEFYMKDGIFTLISKRPAGHLGIEYIVVQSSECVSNVQKIKNKIAYVSIITAVCIVMIAVFPLSVMVLPSLFCGKLFV